MFAGRRRHRRQRAARARDGRRRSQAADAWLVFGHAACLLTRSCCARSARRRARARRASGRSGRAGRRSRRGRSACPRPSEVATLAFAYGISGFGYIVTATSCGDRACGAAAGSPWLDLFADLRAGVIVARCSRRASASSATLRLVIAARTSCRRSRSASASAPDGGGSRSAASCSACRHRIPISRCRSAAAPAEQVAATTVLLTVLWSIGQAAARRGRGGAAPRATSTWVHALARDRRRRVVVGALVFVGRRALARSAAAAR